MMTKVCATLAILSAIGIGGAVMTNGYTQWPVDCCPFSHHVSSDPASSGCCSRSAPTCCEAAPSVGCCSASEAIATEKESTALDTPVEVKIDDPSTEDK